MRHKRIFIFLIGLILFSSFSLALGSFNPEDTREIGYEFLDGGDVVHMWNTQDDYFFEKDSGIQLTNHYEDYWTKNIFCIGYYNNDEWNKIKCSDELTGFNKQIQTDNENFIEAILWKDITYGQYDLRFGVNYTLGLDDENLSVGIYMKNIGINIPFDLGFAWKIKDWEIPHEGVGGDSIYINGTDYRLDGNFDLTFRDMKLIDIVDYNEIITPIPFFIGYDYDEFLRIDWNKNLDYAVKMFGNGNQEDFYVSILINAGHFNPGQEKSTIFQWIDAPFDPVPIGNYTDGNLLDAITDVFVVGDLAYTVSSQGHSFAVFNISAHENPVLVGNYTEASGDYSIASASSVFVLDEYAYVTSSLDDNLVVFNISVVGDPDPIGFYFSDTLMDSPQDVFVLGDFAYVASSIGDSLMVFNISAHGNPVLVGYYNTTTGDFSSNFAQDVFVLGDFAYLASASSSIVVFNISENSDPIPIGFYQDSSGAGSINGIKSVFVLGDFAYTASSTESSFAVFNISAHGNPVLTGYIDSFDDIGGAYSVHVVDDFAYICGNFDKFSVYNVSIKNDPQIIGYFTQSSGAYSIDGCRNLFISDNFGYVTGFTDDNLVVFNISEIIPNTAPTLTASSTSPGTVYTNTNYIASITATDSEETYLNVWTQFYVDNVPTGSLQSFNLTNNTNSEVATLTSSNFIKGEVLIAEIILGDGTVNNSAVNLSSSTVQNTAPTTPTGSSLTAGNLYSGDNLTGTGAGSTDIDTDIITYWYEFYNINDTSTRQAYSSDNTYMIQSSDEGDNIRVRVLATTSDSNSSTYEEENKFISITIIPEEESYIGSIINRIFDFPTDYGENETVDSPGGLFMDYPSSVIPFWGAGIILLIWMAVFAISASSGSHSAILSASFISTIFAIFFSVRGWLNPTITIVLIVVTIIAVIGKSGGSSNY